jgi:hypothetical protein
MKCDKVRYNSRKQAKRALKLINIKSTHMLRKLTDVYHCNLCEGWHATSMNKKTGRKKKQIGFWKEKQIKELVELRKSVKKHAAII